MRGGFLVRLGLAAALTVLVIGCGGGGGGKTTVVPTSNNPTVRIDWPSQTKGIQAPGSAVSAKITIQGGNPDGSDVTIIVNRELDTAYSKAYALPVGLSGQRALTVKFYADKFAAAEVAGVTLQIIVMPDGTIKKTNGEDLGNITTATKIGSVVVPAGQMVPVGFDKTLTAYALTQDGRVDVVGGAISWDIVKGTGPDKLSLSSGGVARGARLGWQDVKATIDGIASSPALVKVGFQSAGIVNERSDVFAACDAPGDRLWAVGTDGNLYQLTKSSLFRNDALVNVGIVRDIARSADNNYVYMPTVEGVKRYNTNTATVDKTFLIDGATALKAEPYAIAVDPTAPLKTAVSFQTNDDKYVTTLYVDGARQANGLTTSTPVRGLTFSTNGRYVFAYTEGGELIRLEVSSSGLAESGTRVTGQAFREAAPFVQALGGNLYTHNLGAFDTTAFTATTGPEPIGIGYGILGEAGITPKLYSAQIESGGRANSIVIYQNNGSGFVPLTGLDIPVDRFVSRLVAADANGFVFLSSGATLVRVSVIN